MKFTKQLRIAVFCGLTLWRTDPGAAAGGTNSFRADLPAPRLLPGQQSFAFTLYGCPDNLEQLKQVVTVIGASGSCG